MAKSSMDIKHILEDFRIPSWTAFLPLILVAVWFVASGLYKVEAEEVGVVQRFGRYLKDVEPGLPRGKLILKQVPSLQTESI